MFENKTTITFPTRLVANAFAVWMETEGLAMFQRSKEFGDSTYRNNMEISVNHDDDSELVHHEIELT